MPNYDRLRRVHVDRAHDPTDFLIVIDFGRGRWPRVPPWRPRPPAPPPPHGGPRESIPDTDSSGGAQPPTPVPNRELEDA